MMDLSAKNRKVFSEINITPLTDVMLVLLIIFMITAPLLIQSGIKVKLPGAVTSDISPEKNINVDIDAAGKIFIANQEIDISLLQGALFGLLQASQAKLVIVNADKIVPHGVVVSVMDSARQAGAEKLFVSTELKGPGKK